MPDSDPPPTKPTNEMPASRCYVDDAVAGAIADIKEHFDRGVRALLEELRENRRVAGAVQELLEKERESRRRGLRIVKDDVSLAEGRVNQRVDELAERVDKVEARLTPPPEPAAGVNGG